MRRRGFTLAEVLVVMAVIGIVSAAVAPALVRTTRPHPADAAAVQVRDLAAGARRAAVRRGVDVVVELDTRDGRWSVDADVEDGPRPAPIATGTLVLPSGVAYEKGSGRVRFRFDPLGAGRGSRLALRGAGRTAAVEIDAWTGEVVAKTR